MTQLRPDMLEWPPRWELTAPESHVLSYRGSAFKGEPLRLALTELVARRVLVVERIEPGRLRARVPRFVLTEGSVRTENLEPPLAAALKVFRNARRRTVVARRDGSPIAREVDGVLPKDLRSAARQTFRPIDRYREKHVAPALVERGLLTMTKSGGRRRRSEWDWTPAGREADAQLEAWLTLAREHLSTWATTDLARASAMAREAGAALLLVRDRYPELELLTKAHRVPLADGGGGGDGLDSGQPDDGHGIHFDGLDLDFGGLLDLGGLGDFGGGGDGGGGGGGDGGGGGGH